MSLSHDTVTVLSALGILLSLASVTMETHAAGANAGDPRQFRAITFAIALLETPGTAISRITSQPIDLPATRPKAAAAVL